MSDYNGWTNRETWLVNLHFNPESKADLDFVKESIEAMEEELPAFIKDFIDFSKINWEELEAAFNDSEEEDC